MTAITEQKIDFLQGTKNRQIVVAVLVVLAFGVIGWRFFIGPDLKKMVKLKAQQRVSLSQAQSLTGISQLKEKIASYQGRFIDNSNDISWLIEDVNRMAGESGVGLISVGSQQMREMANFTKTSLQIEALCTYHELGTFISRIENSERLVKISSLKAGKMTKGKEDTGAELRVLMTLSVYKPSDDPEVSLK